MKTYKYIILFFFLAACRNANKVTIEKEIPEPPPPPFWSDIRNFKNQDSISFPPKNAILFIGSSSFTMWKGMQDSFPGYKIINRGFGGSTLLDQIRYVNDIVFPYEPKQIVIYCGENDLASSDTVIAPIVLDRFMQLCKLIRAKTQAPIAFVSLKPSPSRRHLIPKMLETNRLIEYFIWASKNPFDSTTITFHFIDVHSKMLNQQSQPIPEIFLDDSLHMNAKGYAIWKKEIEPYLIK